MKRSLITGIAAIIVAIATPALADDMGPRGQMLSGATPNERGLVPAPNHFNDPSPQSDQLARGPIEPGDSGFGIIAPYERDMYQSMTPGDSRGRTPTTRSLSIGAPWESDVSGPRLDNGLYLD